ncbi:MAG: hypothetical protein AAGC95_15935 [Pseudomonadota bacterium]
MLELILINTENFSTVDEFPSKLFSLLNIGENEIRYSENSLSGKYYLGKALGVAIKLEQADDSVYPGYGFWLTIDALHLSSVDDPNSLRGFSVNLANFLVAQGLKIARVEGCGRQECVIEY